jgi:hypothetical protein
MSIQALKESLPELSDQALERTYRQFALRALAPVLGYEVSRSRGQKEDWDEILDCFAAERERRRNEKEAQKPALAEWDAFWKRLSDCPPRNRRKRS